MMKRSIVSIVVVILGLYLTKCEEDLPNDYGGDITDIKFSDTWDSGTGEIGTPATSFEYGIKIVYYEVVFQGHANKGGIVRKQWELPLSQTLQVTCFLPKDSKRICGELHYYDETVDMDEGEYEIFLEYFEFGGYEPYNYYVGVNRKFTIE
jgi:hypothetical protein